ncbi:MAG: methyltransferase domain-containing protein [Cyanobacteria bacterium J06635_13]
MSDVDQEFSQSSEVNTDVGSLLENVYRCADKSTWYSAVASAYDRTRPRYPAQILATMQSKVGLQPGKLVLEIGAGSGIATIDLAKLGARMVCLEPSKSAWAIAKEKCLAHPHVEMVNSTFEDWDLPQQQFDVVVATTSFHWVDTEVRYIKTAQALKDNGFLVLLWNTPPQLSYEAHQSLQDVYRFYAPKLGKYEGHQEHQQNIAKFPQQAISSGYFGDLTSHQEVIAVRYTVDDYLTLLSTLSPYIGLTSESRQVLFAKLKTKLEQLSDRNSQLNLSYLSLLQILRRS